MCYRGDEATPGPTKICSKCGVEKSLDQFSKDLTKKDGLQSRCKACNRNYYQANRERVRQHYSNNKVAILKYQAKYACTATGKQVHKQAIAKWYANNHIKAKVHATLRKAVDIGIIKRPLHCSQCGKHCTVDGHHSDYNKPLEVMWLCKACHLSLHRALNRIDETYTMIPPADILETCFDD